MLLKRFMIESSHEEDLGLCEPLWREVSVLEILEPCMPQDDIFWGDRECVCQLNNCETSLRLCLKGESDVGDSKDPHSPTPAAQVITGAYYTQK